MLPAGATKVAGLESHPLTIRAIPWHTVQTWLNRATSLSDKLQEGPEGGYIECLCVYLFAWAGALATFKSTAATADMPCGWENSISRGDAARLPRLGWTALVLTTLVVVALSCHLRYTIASTMPWQCDEVPLLMRFTGLCGHVTNEQEAQAFRPSCYPAYMGALRSLKAPKSYATLHTTTGFWTNLTIHLFGANPLGGRVAPLAWSLVALAVAGTGAFLVTRSLVAACVATLVVSLSPHAITYGAQARGYAEALALAPALLIA